MEVARDLFFEAEPPVADLGTVVFGEIFDDVRDGWGKVAATLKEPGLFDKAYVKDMDFWSEVLCCLRGEAYDLKIGDVQIGVRSDIEDRVHYYGGTVGVSVGFPSGRGAWNMISIAREPGVVRIEGWELSGSLLTAEEMGFLEELSLDKIKKRP